MKKTLTYMGLAAVVLVGLMLLPLSGYALSESSCKGGSCAPYGYYNNYASANYYPYNWYQNQNYAPSNYYNSGFRGYDWSRYPGSTEICSKWIPGHWVPVRVMVPGRWVYRPVWIQGYPTTKYQWVSGFWQTTQTHGRPDVYVWGSHSQGWYGMSPQQYQTMGGNGYFNAQGVWVSSR